MTFACLDLKIGPILTIFDIFKARKKFWKCFYALLWVYNNLFKILLFKILTGVDRRIQFPSHFLRYRISLDLYVFWPLSQNNSKNSKICSNWFKKIKNFIILSWISIEVLFILSNLPAGKVLPLGKLHYRSVKWSTDR